jgi:hemerythrin-like domain-containing protein
MTSTASATPETEEESAAAHDPVLNLRRDHTLLQMLAEGFHRMATEIRTGGKLDLERLEEGVRLHEQFLVGTHHRKEELLDEELARSGDTKYSRLLDTCRKEHTAARTADEKIRALFDRLKGGENAVANELADTLDKEADRWTQHLRHEEDQLYSTLHLELPRELRTDLSTEMRKIRGETAALEERLTSWTSRWGPASD